MFRSKKGQSALEYAALITLLAAVVAVFLWGNQAGSLKSKVESVYSSASGKVDTAKGWLDNTMGGGGGGGEGGE